jgi:hypothetical protein
MKTNKPLKVGDSYQPKTGSVYRTRDTVNALKLARLITSINEWKAANEHKTDKATQRHVKAIKGVL